MAILTFGEKLADLRIAKHLKQSEVAKAIGVNKGTISAYEANRSYPKYEKIVKIAEFFGVSYDYLMCEQEFSNPTVVDFAEVYSVFQGVPYTLGSIYNILIGLNQASRNKLIDFLQILEQNQAVDLAALLRVIDVLRNFND